MIASIGNEVRYFDTFCVPALGCPIFEKASFYGRLQDSFIDVFFGDVIQLHQGNTVFIGSCADKTGCFRHRHDRLKRRLSRIKVKPLDMPLPLRVEGNHRNIQRLIRLDFFTYGRDIFFLKGVEQTEHVIYGVNANNKN